MTFVLHKVRGEGYIGILLLFSFLNRNRFSILVFLLRRVHICLPWPLLSLWCSVLSGNQWSLFLPPMTFCCCVTFFFKWKSFEHFALLAVWFWGLKIFLPSVTYSNVHGTCMDERIFSIRQKSLILFRCRVLFQKTCWIYGKGIKLHFWWGICVLVSNVLVNQYFNLLVYLNRYQNETNCLIWTLQWRSKFLFLLARGSTVIMLI